MLACLGNLSPRQLPDSPDEVVSLTFMFAMYTEQRPAQKTKKKQGFEEMTFEFAQQKQIKQAEHIKL